MGQCGAQRREVRQPFPDWHGPEFRNGFVAPHQDKTLATVGHAIDVLRKMAGDFSNCESLCYQQSSLQKLKIILSDVACNCQ
jgi:hypothetical protein